MTEATQEGANAVETFAIGTATEVPLVGKNAALRRQQAIVAMGRRASVAPDPVMLIGDAASLLAETLDAEMHGVAQVVPGTNSLSVTIIETASDSQGQEMRVVEETSVGEMSLARYALQVAHPVVVSDLAKDKRISDPLLLSHKVVSAIAVPLALHDRTFGTLSVYSRRKNFAGEDVLFAETIGHLVATTVARKQAETELSMRHGLADDVLRAVEALVLLLDSEGLIVDVNAACREVTEFSLEEMRGRHVWSVLPPHEEADRFRAVFETMQKKPEQGKYESILLTKHSDRRFVNWACSPVLSQGGTLQSIILTGIDITDQRTAEQRAEKAEAALDRARRNAEGSRSIEKVIAEEAASGAFERLPLDKHSDRGTRPRRSYPYKQRIAYIVGDGLPDRDTFVEVDCNDIAAGGFSYYSTSPPPAESLVVALGKAPKITYLIAQVAHVTRVSRDGKKHYLIGCNYVGHATY